MDLYFRKCKKDDLTILAIISEETFTDAFETSNNPADFLEYTSKAFSLSTLATELENKNSHFFFIYAWQELVGYFKLNEYKAQTDLQDDSALELERIYIKKQFQGKRVGVKTLSKVIKIANQKEKRYIWLGVWEHNTDAIRFYKSHGFTKFGTHPYYVGSDEQIDWLMKKELYYG